MVKKNNEDMAGSVSEPKGAIPEVRPARSLWPRPHENVRVEPVLDTVRGEAPPVELPIAAPHYEPVAEFSAGPEEGYRAPEPRIDFEDEPAPEISTQASAPEIPEPDFSPELAPEFPIAPDEFRSPAAEEAPELEEHKLQEPEPEEVREEPVAAEPVREEPVREEPVSAPEPEPVFVPRREDRPEPPRHVREDRPREDRHVSVLDAADRQKPALEDGREGKTGKFVAMAAGIVVALALGTVGLVYGAGALGFKFGGGSNSDTTASASAPATPAVNPDDLKAMENRVQELQAELERLRQEKSANAPASTPENQPANASGGEPANPPVEQAAASQPEPQSQPVASIPGPTPAPNAVNAPPAPTPTAPPPQAVAPAPSSEPTPKASTSNTGAPTETARTEPTPAPKPPAAAPPPAPKPKPTETARTEPAPPPPPSYRTQPGYEDPQSAGSPEMPVLQNWAVRDVYNGIAVVQGGRGAPLEVEPGDELPGGNRVLAIRRLGGNWAVITERGIISGY